MKFDILHCQTMYHGRAFDVHHLHVRLPDGRETNYNVVDHPGAVALVPFDNEGNIWLVRQYRVAVQRTILELPAGTLSAGEPPEDCARRELREEIGQAAGKLLKLGEVFLAPGYSSEHLHIFLATDLTPDALPGDDDEFLQIVTLPLNQIYQMAYRGEIEDGKTLAALLMAQPHLLPCNRSEKTGT